MAGLTRRRFLRGTPAALAAVVTGCMEETTPIQRRINEPTNTPLEEVLDTPKVPVGPPIVNPIATATMPTPEDTPTPYATETPTRTPTATRTPTETPRPTETATPMPIATDTPTPIITPTSSLEYGILTPGDVEGMEGADHLITLPFRPEDADKFEFRYSGFTNPDRAISFSVDKDIPVYSPVDAIGIIIQDLVLVRGGENLTVPNLKRIKLKTTSGIQYELRMGDNGENIVANSIINPTGTVIKRGELIGYTANSMKESYLDPSLNNSQETVSRFEEIFLEDERLGLFAFDLISEKSIGLTELWLGNEPHFYSPE